MNANQNNLLKELLSSRNLQNDSGEVRYAKFGLKYNPFPKSGTTSINNAESINAALIPVDDNVMELVQDYVFHSLYAIGDKENKFLSASIVGDYGSGKTQLLIYIKYLLSLAVTIKNPYKNPFIIYIDNPGVKLSELIGYIISKIGEENFKKYLWNKIIEKLVHDINSRVRLNEFQPKAGTSLFDGLNPNPYAPENLNSYKQFLDVWIRYLNPKRKKDFDAALKSTIIEILYEETKDSTVAKYFYELMSEDYGTNRVWDALSQGYDKNLEKKEVELINAIVDLIEWQGYTDFYILVDEFEDITEGRLSKSEIDNYVRNLRTLIDNNRKWCVVFSMTSNALRKLRSISPPLADRLTNREIKLTSLDLKQAAKITLTYLNLGRETDTDDLSPFDESGINELNVKTFGNARKYLKSCFELLEKAVNDLPEDGRINDTFIKNNFRDEQD